MGLSNILYSKPALVVKKGIMSILASNAVAGAIRRIYKNRIPHYTRTVYTDHPLIGNHIVSDIFFKAYESAEIRFTHKHLRADLPVVELGASLGVMAMQIAYKTKQPIYNIEANPELLPIIANNLAKNNITNCTPLNYIVATSGSYYFVKGNDNTTGHISTTAVPGAIPVKSISLTDLLPEIGVKDYVLICDIEGAEVYILKDDIKALKNCQQIIIELHATEYNGQQVSVNDLTKLIEGAGFTIADAYGPNIVFVRK